MQSLTINQLIQAEKKRQKEGLELIASENFVSPPILEATGSVLTNKYAEGYPEKRYYGGCNYVDQIENRAREGAKKLFGAAWVNVQPHAGSQANFAVYSALIRPGDRVLGLNLAEGGHLTHGAPVNFSGNLYKAYSYGVDPTTARIDWNQVEQVAQRVQPHLIICGASAYSRRWNYKRLRSIADQVGAFLWCDMAHTAGLIAGGQLENPVPYCDVVTTTTHKTLRGPRGGMILIGKDRLLTNDRSLLKRKKPTYLSQRLDQAVFPGSQGGPLVHVIAAKALCFEEAQQPAFEAYAKQICKNAQALAGALQGKGFTIVSGGTDNHLFLVDLTNQALSGKKAERLLEEAGMTVNKNMIPNDPKSPFITSGIRIGTPAVTTRGLKEDGMKRIASYIEAVLKKPNNASMRIDIKREIAEWMGPKPLFAA